MNRQLPTSTTTSSNQPWYRNRRKPHDTRKGKHNSDPEHHLSFFQVGMKAPRKTLSNIQSMLVRNYMYCSFNNFNTGQHNRRVW